MMWLERFTPDQRRLLVRLPYRVGAYISSSDNTGGMAADVQEKMALRTLLTAFVQDTLKSQEIQELMEETITKQSEWPQWVDDLDNVPDECRQIVDLLNDCLSAKEIGAFKSNLIEIALTVAMAFREVDVTASNVEKLKVYSNLWIERWRAFVGGKALIGSDEVLNVSAAEKAALVKLGHALQRDIRIAGHSVNG
jgi:hypothetical protein